MTEQRVVPIDYNNPQMQTIERAAVLLARGELVVAPTETRYGLLGRIDSADALARVYGAKERRSELPVAVFVSSVDQLPRYGEMTKSSRQLAARFLPGPLTLVLKAVGEFDKPVVQQGCIGLRVSSSPVVKAVLAHHQVPLTATSANLSGRGDVETVDQIVNDFGDRVALYLDAGPLAGPVSTVVRCREDRTELLREGAISRAEIEAAVGDGDE